MKGQACRLLHHISVQFDMRLLRSRTALPYTKHWRTRLVVSTMNLTTLCLGTLRLPLMAVLLCLASCSSFSTRDPLTVNLIDIAPLDGGNLEFRFALELRVQNPNADELNYDGISLALDLNGKQLARGVSNVKGKVPAFGEAIITVPMSVSAFAVFRQAWATAQTTPTESLPYRLSGKLGGNFLGSQRFVDEGSLTWPDFDTNR